MTTPMRSYIVITADFTHSKYDDAYKVVLLNRKTLMPAKWQQFEGKIGMFGGAVEKGETPKAAICREVKEELGLWLMAEPTLEHSTSEYSIFSYHLGIFSQARMTQLAGGCCEGLLTVFNEQSLKAASDSQFLDPYIPVLCMRLLKAT